MIWLLRHTCVSPASLSNAYHESERRDLGISFPSCVSGSCLRESSCSCGDLERSFTRFWRSTVAESSSALCEDECGGTRSRDLDLSYLLERPLCSADSGDPADGEEGLIAVKFSSDTSSCSGVTMG